MPLSVGAEMEAYGDHAAAVCKFSEDPSKKPYDCLHKVVHGKVRWRSLFSFFFLARTFHDSAKHTDIVLWCAIAPLI